MKEFDETDSRTATLHQEAEMVFAGGEYDFLGTVLSGLIAELQRCLNELERLRSDRKSASEGNQSSAQLRKTVFTVARRLLEEETVAGLLQKSADGARELTGARLGRAGYFYQEGSAWAHSVSLDVPECLVEKLVSSGEGGVCRELIERGSPLRLSDEEVRSRWEWRGLSENLLPLRGFLGAPLPGGDLSPKGLIMLTDKQGGACFTEEDEAVLEELAAFASLGLQHIEAGREAEARAEELEAIFSSLYNPVTVYDARGTVIKANRRAVELYGFNLVGMDPELLAAVCSIQYPDGRDVPGEELPARRALRGERFAAERFTMLNARDEVRHVSVSAAPLRKNGRNEGAIVVWQDITEQEN